MFRRELFLICFLLLFLVSCAPKHPKLTVKLDVKDDAYFNFIKADLLAIEGKTQKSTAELLKLTEKYPKMAFFHFLLAQNFGQEKRFKDSVDSCKKAIELAPDFVEAQIYLGKLYAIQGEHPEASREFSNIVHNNPKVEEVYLLLAGEYIAMREYNRAIEALKQLLGLNPDAVTAYFYLGTIYDENLHNTNEALKMYQEALNIDPGNVNVHNAVGELYLKHKDLKKALAKYREILHLEPDEVAVQLRIALIHYELKEYDQAINIFEEILDKNPEADKIRFYLGVLYEITKQPSTAVLNFEEVPPNSSYYKDARLHVAALYRQMDRIEDAKVSLHVAITEKNQTPEFYEYLAAILEEAKDFKESIGVLEAGHTAIPGDEKIAFLLAILYEKIKDRDHAIATMREVLKINPKNAGALNYIGYTYAERGENLQDALDMIQSALVIKPDDGYFTDSLGWVYFRLGDYERSYKYLMRANSLVPGEPTVLYHIGEVLKAFGDNKDALKYYEQALDAAAKKHEQGDEDINKIRQKIEDLKNQ